jgi:hypothetical protein
MCSGIQKDILPITTGPVDYLEALEKELPEYPLHRLGLGAGCS